MSSSAGEQPIVAVPDNVEQEEKVSRPRHAWEQFGHFSCPEGLKIQDAVARFNTSKELKVGRFCQPYASKKGKIKTTVGRCIECQSCTGAKATQYKYVGHIKDDDSTLVTSLQVHKVGTCTKTAKARRAPLQAESQAASVTELKRLEQVMKKMSSEDITPTSVAKELAAAGHPLSMDAKKFRAAVWRRSKTGRRKKRHPVVTYSDEWQKFMSCHRDLDNGIVTFAGENAGYPGSFICLLTPFFRQIDSWLLNLALIFFIFNICQPYCFCI